MEVKGIVLSVSAPSAMGLLRALLIPFAFFNGTIWSVKFKCGHCKKISTVQHEEHLKTHICPICRTRNKLNRTSY